MLTRAEKFAFFHKINMMEEGWQAKVIDLSKEYTIPEIEKQCASVDEALKFLEIARAEFPHAVIQVQPMMGAVQIVSPIHADPKTGMPLQFNIPFKSQFVGGDDTSMRKVVRHSVGLFLEACQGGVQPTQTYKTVNQLVRG